MLSPSIKTIKEMSHPGLKCDFAVGIDTSHAFIRAARQLMQQRSMVVSLKEEGLLRRETVIRLPNDWRSDRVEFVVE